MTRIKSIKDLQAEKQRLSHRREALEREIQYNWYELKENLNPLSIARETFSRVFQSKAGTSLITGGILKSALTIGAGLLTKKFADGLRKKISSLFKKKSPDF